MGDRHLPRPIFDAMEGGGNTASGVWAGALAVRCGGPGPRRSMFVKGTFVRARCGARVSINLPAEDGWADWSVCERLSPLL